MPKDEFEGYKKEVIDLAGILGEEEEIKIAIERIEKKKVAEPEKRKKRKKPKPKTRWMVSPTTGEYIEITTGGEPIPFRMATKEEIRIELASRKEKIEELEEDLARQRDELDRLAGQIQEYEKMLRTQPGYTVEIRENIAEIEGEVEEVQIKEMQLKGRLGSLSKSVEKLLALLGEAKEIIMEPISIRQDSWVLYPALVYTKTRNIICVELNLLVESPEYKEGVPWTAEASDIIARRISNFKTKNRAEEFLGLASTKGKGFSMEGIGMIKWLDSGTYYNFSVRQIGKIDVETETGIRINADDLAEVNGYVRKENMYVPIEEVKNAK